MFRQFGDSKKRNGEFAFFIKMTYPTAPKIHIILDQGPYNKIKATAETAKIQTLSFIFYQHIVQILIKLRDYGKS